MRSTDYEDLDMYYAIWDEYFAYYLWCIEQSGFKLKDFTPKCFDSYRSMECKQLCDKNMKYADEIQIRDKKRVDFFNRCVISGLIQLHFHKYIEPWQAKHFFGPVIPFGCEIKDPDEIYVQVKRRKIKIL